MIFYRCHKMNPTDLSFSTEFALFTMDEDLYAEKQSELMTKNEAIIYPFFPNKEQLFPITIISKRTIGEGTFAFVDEVTVRDQTGRNSLYALKINKFGYEKVLKYEDEILRLLHTDPQAQLSIVNRFGLFQIDKKSNGILLERMTCDLKEHLNFFPNGLCLEKTIQIAYQLFQALDVLFRNNIVHLDIKPNNILVNLVQHPILVKLTDFGKARKEDHPPLQDSSKHRTILEYRDPSNILRMPCRKSSDMWSMAIVVMEVYLGIRPPYKELNDIKMLSFYEELLGPFPINFINKIPPEGKAIFIEQQSNQIKQQLHDNFPLQRPLQEIINTSAISKEDNDPTQFYLLLKMALEYDPNERPLPFQLLNYLQDHLLTQNRDRNLSASVKSVYDSPGASLTEKMLFESTVAQEKNPISPFLRRENNWMEEEVKLSEEEKETAEPTQSSVNQRSESPLLFDLEMESDTNT